MKRSPLLSPIPPQKGICTLPASPARFFSFFFLLLPRHVRRGRFDSRCSPFFLFPRSRVGTNSQFFHAWFHGKFPLFPPTRFSRRRGPFHSPLPGALRAREPFDRPALLSLKSANRDVVDLFSSLIDSAGAKSTASPFFFFSPALSRQRHQPSVERRPIAPFLSRLSTNQPPTTFLSTGNIKDVYRSSPRTLFSAAFATCCIRTCLALGVIPSAAARKKKGLPSPFFPSGRARFTNTSSRFEPATYRNLRFDRHFLFLFLAAFLFKHSAFSLSHQIGDGVPFSFPPAAESRSAILEGQKIGQVSPFFFSTSIPALPFPWARLLTSAKSSLGGEAQRQLLQGALPTELPSVISFFHLSDCDENLITFTPWWSSSIHLYSYIGDLGRNLSSPPRSAGRTAHFPSASAPNCASPVSSSEQRTGWTVSVFPLPVILSLRRRFHLFPQSIDLGQPSLPLPAEGIFAGSLF